ncbi:MAG: hypothetical protein JWR77_496 [Rhizorhabdus sp.]|nr:hypothetical protein [Rhizorhabdus sp.]
MGERFRGTEARAGFRTMRWLTVLAIGAIGTIGALPAAAQLQVNKRADLAQPVKLGPNQAAIVVCFRRPDAQSAGKSGMVAFARYDLAGRDVVFQPRDAKKKGDTTTYWVDVRSGDRKLPLDHAVMVVTAGDYVLFGATPGPAAQVMNSFCLGSPTFTVKPGEAVYFGDVTPYLFAKLADGQRAMAMAYSSNIADARAALAGQPDLAAALKPADLHNDATFGCVAQAMLAYAVPGAPSLESPAAPTTAAGAK